MLLESLDAAPKQDLRPIKIRKLGSETRISREGFVVGLYQLTLSCIDFSFLLSYPISGSCLKISSSFTSSSIFEIDPPLFFVFNQGTQREYLVCGRRKEKPKILDTPDGLSV